MFDVHSINRRQFVAGSSGLLVAGALHGSQADAAEPAGESKLAIHGGDKAVQQSVTYAPRWGDPEREQLEAMLRQNTLFYWGGPQTKLLIERFREFCPLEYVHTCSSGTAAIHIAVASAGIGLGDEVITSPVTDIGTVIGVLYQGGVPVFADLGAGTLQPGRRGRAAADHPEDQGHHRRPPDRQSVRHGRDHGVGRRAQSDRHRGLLPGVGRPHARAPIGTVGHFACFSLQNSKHVTCGDGGVVATSDERFGPLLQRFGDKGAARGVTREGGGFRAFATNYRMSEPQAAVVAGQLTRLEEIAAKRARLGNLLTEHIAGIPGIVPHDVHPEDRAVYWFYMFRVQPEAFRINRDDFARTLRAEGAPASGGYIGVPLYGEPVFREHGFFAGRWPVKEFG
jgi:perosamine synthetase